MPTRPAQLIRWAAPAVLATVALATLGAPASADPGAPAGPGALTLVAAAPKQTVYRYRGSRIDLSQLAAYAVAGGGPVEFRSGRESYSDPVTTTVSTGSGDARRTVTLPPNTSTSVSTLTRFLTLVVVDAKGRKVFGRYLSFCPNSSSTARFRAEAPVHSPYPYECGTHPFAVGSVLGVQDGWSTRALTSDYDDESAADATMKGKNGRYTATIGIAAAYRAGLGVSKADSTVTIAMDVVYGDPYDDIYDSLALGPAGRAPKPDAGRGAGASATYAAAAVQDGQVPDLRALPAFDISLSRHTVKVNGKKQRRTYIDFAATVWNAGPSPLVVDGFRRPGEDLMDAYQYFFDAAGNQVGSAPAGTLEWDGRKGHTHWHFTDFARYSLVDADRKTTRVSGKEAFCLVPTDPVDTRVEGANWQPASTDLSTACGGHSSLGIREVMDVGWGDTYDQSRPGQSLNVTTLPKGTYYISVDANPERKLAEVSTDNNTALRKISIGGKPGGTRTLKVYPYQGVSA